MPTETKYAQSGDVSIAYSVIGDSPIDLVIVYGWVASIEGMRAMPGHDKFLERLASFSRVIQFDKRGTGMSDRVTQAATMEERMDDVRAVMDAVGSQRAAVMGISEGGVMATLFAATYPERTSALILYGTYAAYPNNQRTEAEWSHFMNQVRREWGSEAMAREILSWYVPSVPVDEQLIQNIQKLMLVGASPSGVIALERMNFDLDTRSVLPIINVPTLVMHREEDGGVLVEEGRYLAQHIPNARMVELQGNDHLHSVGDSNSILDEIEEFLTGVRDPLERNRVLATVMFTDIVGSTEHVLELGDRRWRELLDQHHALVRMQLSRFHGHEVDTTGDGFFATFDGPARAIRCAVSISDGMQPVGLQIRVGLHAGECELMDKKVSGIAVHIGARVMAHSGANEVLVSSTLKDLVAGSGITFEERGVHDLKGVPGKWQLYAVTREREQL